MLSISQHFIATNLQEWFLVSAATSTFFSFMVMDSWGCYDIFVLHLLIVLCCLAVACFHPLFLHSWSYFLSSSAWTDNEENDVINDSMELCSMDLSICLTM